MAINPSNVWKIIQVVIACEIVTSKCLCSADHLLPSCRVWASPLLHQNVHSLLILPHLWPLRLAMEVAAIWHNGFYNYMDCIDDDRRSITMVTFLYHDLKYDQLSVWQ